jgi:glycosyltransferase involved in cell wall biosynthesis
VLEAMAMAKPLVATHDATRSLGVKAGVHLWVENGSEKFAHAVVEALIGPRRDEIARNARKYVEDHHSWPDLLTQVDRHLEALNPAHKTGAPLRAAGGQRLGLSARCKS